MVKSFKKNTEIDLQESRSGQSRRGKNHRIPWQEQLVHLTFSKNFGLGQPRRCAHAAGLSASGRRLGRYDVPRGSAMVLTVGSLPCSDPEPELTTQLVREGEKLGLQP